MEINIGKRVPSVSVLAASAPDTIITCRDKARCEAQCSASVLTCSRPVPSPAPSGRAQREVGGCPHWVPVQQVDCGAPAAQTRLGSWGRGRRPPGRGRGGRRGSSCREQRPPPGRRYRTDLLARQGPAPASQSSVTERPIYQILFQRNLHKYCQFPFQELSESCLTDFWYDMRLTDWLLTSR